MVLTSSVKYLVRFYCDGLKVPLTYELVLQPLKHTTKGA